MNQHVECDDNLLHFRSLSSAVADRQALHLRRLLIDCVHLAVREIAVPNAEPAELGPGRAGNRVIVD